MKWGEGVVVCVLYGANPYFRKNFKKNKKQIPKKSKNPKFKKIKIFKIEKSKKLKIMVFFVCVCARA